MCCAHSGDVNHWLLLTRAKIKFKYLVSEYLCHLLDKIFTFWLESMMIPTLSFVDS